MQVIHNCEYIPLPVIYTNRKKRFVPDNRVFCSVERVQLRAFNVHFNKTHCTVINNVIYRSNTDLRTCIHSRKCRTGERFCRQTRQIFADILCVCQENLTMDGGKRSA